MLYRQKKSLEDLTSSTGITSYMATSNQCVLYIIYRPRLQALIDVLVQENILISDAGRAQIADFGVSVIPELKGFTTTTNRNVRHSAPELVPLSEYAEPTKPTQQGDIYSLGILLLQVRLLRL